MTHTTAIGPEEGEVDGLIRTLGCGHTITASVEQYERFGGGPRPSMSGLSKMLDISERMHDCETYERIAEKRRYRDGEVPF